MLIIYCILILLRYYIISLILLVIMDLLNYKCGVFDDCWIMGVIKLMNMLSNLFGYLSWYKWFISILIK